jgi:hypothetical protein
MSRTRNYKKDMVAAPTQRAVEARQEKVAGGYVKAVQAMDRKFVGTPEGVVGSTEAALADHSHGGVVGLVFGAFGECSQPVDLLVGSFGKLIGEQGYAEMGYRTPEVGSGVATRVIRREWPMSHWREWSANLMWWNLEHVTGAYSEHAKTKRYTQRRAAWGDAHRAAGTHRANGTSRKCNHRALPRGARA